MYGSAETLVTRLTWFDRSGRLLRNVGGSVTYNSPALSFDEKTIVAERFDPEIQSEDLWLIDTTRDVPSRFTSYPNSDAFLSGRRTRRALCSRRREARRRICIRRR